MTLDDVPYGDYYKMIYNLAKDNKTRVYINVNPHQDKKGKYYQLTFRDMMNEIEKKSKSKITHFIMIAESGLDGIIYRYNNYGNGELLECGSTEGYA